MTEATMKNQEILNALNEKIKAAEEALLYLNQTKAGLERVIANSAKTPVEEAYKRWMGQYPTLEYYGGYPRRIFDRDNVKWDAFQAGYNAADFDSWKSFKRGYEAAYNDYKKEQEVNTLQEKDWKVDVKTNLKPHWEPKPQEPEETEQSLKKAFHREIKQGVVSSSTKQLTLHDICKDWCDDDENPPVTVLVARIRDEWLLKSIEETCGLNEYDEAYYNGWNMYRENLIKKLV